MRLIDADALATHMADWQLSACSEQYDTIEEAIDAVTSAPTIDAVPVVRCKDCIYYQDNNGGYPHNECRWRSDETPDADDFCSMAERKDNED